MCVCVIVGAATLNTALEQQCEMDSQRERERNVLSMIHRKAIESHYKDILTHICALLCVKCMYIYCM